MESETIAAAATVMAASELLPAQPSDLTQILTDPVQRDRFLDSDTQGLTNDLARYLCERIDLGRRDHWFKSLSALVQSGTAFPILAGTACYPPKLAQCWDAPPLLFATSPIPRQHTVAVVGSRDATPQALDDARMLGAELARRNIVVASGLAAGVDTAAHTGALDANGPTIAVLGTGIYHVYPAENIGLAERIRLAGAVISQFAPDAPRTGTTFLRRNHVIAGLADVSIVVDGRARSGSRHEVEQAIGYGRRAYMWAPTLGDQPWARAVVESGAASFIESVEAVLDDLRTSN